MNIWPNMDFVKIWSTKKNHWFPLVHQVYHQLMLCILEYPHHLRHRNHALLGSVARDPTEWICPCWMPPLWRQTSDHQPPRFRDRDSLVRWYLWRKFMIMAYMYMYMYMCVYMCMYLYMYMDKLYVHLLYVWIGDSIRYMLLVSSELNYPCSRQRDHSFGMNALFSGTCSCSDLSQRGDIRDPLAVEL